uniref:Uncharacterized protein n=1 Tax=Glossina palpalis gambiensis TaxID=67801 RepID=A0A1B0C6F3_9MUSC
MKIEFNVIGCRLFIPLIFEVESHNVIFSKKENAECNSDHNKITDNNAIRIVNDVSKRASSACVVEK